MKLKVTLTVIFLLSAKIFFAQNLVTNNGFETNSAAPAGPGEWWKATGWNDVNNVASFTWPYASPDYLSTLGSGQAQLPNSIFGTVSPYSGNAVMGLVAYYAPSVADYREYIARQLSSPMTIGQAYTVSFMLTNGSSNQYCGSGCNHLGICFSTSALTQAQHEPINVTPQVEISTVWWNTTWQLISFTFTPTAAYQYITIGNFYNDASTSHTVFRAAASSPNGAYYFIDEINVSPAQPMPVELIAFTGKNIGRANELSWSTASEINNDHFEIEHSDDGESFHSIGRVKGAGNNSAVAEYSYTDYSPFAAVNYYRLKQVDVDGRFQYSHIVALESKLNNLCALTYEGNSYYLNPSTNCIAEVYDVHGRLCRRHELKAGEPVLVDLSMYANGVFIIRIMAEGVVQNIKLVK